MRITKVKIESFCNKLKSKSNFEDCENRCKSEKPIKDLWLCIECCHLSCGRQTNECAIKHKDQNDHHSLVINIADYKIWCYECDEDIEILINSKEEEQENYKNGKNPNLDKMIKFKEKISEYTQRFLKNNKKIENNYLKKENEHNLESKKEAANKKNTNINNLFLFGLVNLGNTCYFNSILQCLYSVNELTEVYLNTQRLDFTEEAPNIVNTAINNVYK